MFVQIILARKQLIAELAIEHLLAGMGDHVPQQMLLAAKRFIAAGLLTFERSQTQM